MDDKSALQLVQRPPSSTPSRKHARPPVASAAAYSRNVFAFNQSLGGRNAAWTGRPCGVRGVVLPVAIGADAMVIAGVALVTAVAPGRAAPDSRRGSRGRGPCRAPAVVMIGVGAGGAGHGEAERRGRREAQDQGLQGLVFRSEKDVCLVSRIGAADVGCIGCMRKARSRCTTCERGRTRRWSAASKTENNVG